MQPQPRRLLPYVLVLAVAVTADLTASWWLLPLATWAKGRHDPVDTLASTLPPPKVTRMAPVGHLRFDAAGNTYSTRGNTITARTPDGAESWSFEVPHEVGHFDGIVVDVDGTVYTTGTVGTIAIKDGAVMWRSTPEPKPNDGSEMALSLAIAADGSVVVGEYGELAVVERDGHIRWNTTKISGCVTVARIRDGVVCGEHELTALVASDGTPRWSASFTGNGYIGAVADDGTMYLTAHPQNVFMSGEESLIAVDAGGHEKWRHRLDGPPAGVAVVNGDVIATGGALYRFRPDGSEAWHVRPNDYLASGPVIVGNTIVAAGRHRVLGFDGSGRFLWAVDVPPDDRRFVVPELSTDGRGRVAAVTPLLDFAILMEITAANERH